MRIKVKNKLDVLSKLTYVIANNHVQISSLNVKRDSQDEKNSYIEVFLFFDASSSKDPQDELKNILVIQQQIKDKSLSEDLPDFLDVISL
jgi:uncharacterized protein with ACT and thioredoxin-like domain